MTDARDSLLRAVRARLGPDAADPVGVGDTAELRALVALVEADPGDAEATSLLPPVVDAYRRSLAVLPEGHRDVGTLQAELGVALRVRDLLTAVPDDIGEMARDGLIGQPERAIWLLNHSGALLATAMNAMVRALADGEAVRSSWTSTDDGSRRRVHTLTASTTALNLATRHDALLLVSRALWSVTLSVISHIEPSVIPPFTGEPVKADPTTVVEPPDAMPGGHDPEQAEPPRRLLSGSLPTRASPDAEISLIVRVVVAGSSNTGRFSSPLTDVDVPPDGLPLTIFVESPRGLEVQGPVQQVLRVPREGDSAPLRFTLRTVSVGVHDLTVTAWSGARCVGSLRLQVPVGERASAVDSRSHHSEMSPDLRPGDGVTLQVLLNNGQYLFQLLTDGGRTPYNLVPGRALTERPSAAVERTRELLGRMARGETSSGYTDPNAVTLMRNLGIGLWRDMVPQELQEQFWSLHDHISTFTVVSTHDTMPWEMVYPKARGRDHGFLVEQFPVLRQVHAQRRPEQVCTTGARFIVPPGSPVDAGQEVDRLKAILKAPNDETITDLETLISLIESGDAGLLHFACHSTFVSGAGGRIEMSGGDLIPDLLNNAVVEEHLRGRSPLVFVNACSSAPGVPRYTGMVGFASQFMRAGAGAFIGTLWDVRSSAAGHFAEEFYSRLTAPSSLGEAALGARTAMRHENSADPTWLAYTIFGDPDASPLSTRLEPNRTNS